jgi:hypothetical protein
VRLEAVFLSQVTQTVNRSFHAAVADFRQLKRVPRHSLPGRAMAQAVSCRPITADARIRARIGLCGISDGPSGTGTGFSVFPCQYLSTVTLYTLITLRMNNRPVGGRSSETQADAIDINNSRSQWPGGLNRWP